MQPAQGGGGDRAAAAAPSVERLPVAHTAAQDFAASKPAADLAAQALKARLSGDHEKYKELMDAVKVASDPNVSVVSEIGPDGRPRALSNGDILSGQAPGINLRREKRPEEMFTEGKRERYYSDDTATLEELVAKEKRGGGTSYDENFADSIVRSKRFKETKEDDMNDLSDEEAQLAMHERDRAIADDRKLTQEVERCRCCLEAPKIEKHRIICLGEKSYVALPAGPVVDGHCIIVPMAHEVACTALDEDTTAEMLKFKQVLQDVYFQTMQKEVVFLETVLHRQKRWHTYIDAIPVPRDVAGDAPLYFKKALLEADVEWSAHESKRVIDTRDKGGIAKCVPDQFAYFHAEFGPNGGFAHVVEDEATWSKHFGMEVLGGMMDLPPNAYIRPKRQSMEGDIKRVCSFLRKWEPHEPEEFK